MASRASAGRPVVVFGSNLSSQRSFLPRFDFLRPCFYRYYWRQFSSVLRHAPCCETAQAHEEEPVTTKQQAILLVEDDPAMRSLIFDELWDMGYRITEAAGLPIEK